MTPAEIRQVLEREYRGVEQGLHAPVMLWGPPGIGKSQIVAQVAQHAGVPLIDLRLAQLEPSDLRGIPFRAGEHVEWSVPAMLPDCERHGERGILFLDEINAAVPTVSAAAYQLILDRRLGEYRVPDGWAIFAAGNRLGDRGVTYAMPSPLANRFTHFEVEVSLDDWQAWAESQGIDERIRRFLATRRDLLLDFDPHGEAHAFPSPRTWEFADRALKKFGDQPAPILSRTLAGCVGEPAAGAFMRFLDTDIPDVEAILAGQDVAMPRDVDGQLELAEALVERLRSLGTDQAGDEARAVLRAAQRFPQSDVGLKLVMDMRALYGRSLYALPEFGDWADEVADLVTDTDIQDA